MASKKYIKEEPILVMIVEDSPLMRKELKRLIESDSLLRVVGLARNGEEAVQMARELKPDVITMDVNMPGIDGLTATQMILNENRIPIIMLSSLTQRGEITTYEALELGAVDFIAKPSGTISVDIGKITKELHQKIRAAALVNFASIQTSIERAENRKKSERNKNRLSAVERKAAGASMRSSGMNENIGKKNIPTSRSLQSSLRGLGQNRSIGIDHLGEALRGQAPLIVIGQSTGGPNTIFDVLEPIPEDFPATIFVVQHMPGNFTTSFAERMNEKLSFPFCEIKDGDELKVGQGYLAPGDIHTIVRKQKWSKGAFSFHVTPVPRDSLYSPSVEVSMDSVVCNYPNHMVIGVLLTGMGSDGSDGMVKILKMGGRTIAESEETAVVFGMPREAIEKGGAELVLPSYKIGEKLIEWVNELSSGAGAGASAQNKAL